MIEIESHVVQPGEVIDVGSAVVDQETSCLSLMDKIGDQLLVLLSDVFFKILKNSIG